MPNREPVARESGNIAEEQREKLRELFPEVFTEGKVDFEKLRATLGDFVEDRPERYSFSWAGKRDAIRLLQMPTRATLVPDREESVNFDETEHVFIEGDNLEVLKILYKSYFGRIKLIYIDPPYNTGNDFIYPDNYADPLDTYLRLTGQKDSNGNLLTSNPDTSGRYHSSWLSMMYPRLFLTRQLLRDDGVIFISIDDNEIHNLRMMLNEIFGESNFVAIFPWKKRTAKSDVPFGISQDFEWIICYAKGPGFFAGVQHQRNYYETDDYPNDRWRLSDLTTQRTPEERPNSAFDLVDPKTGKMYPLNPKRVWGVTKDSFPDYYARGKVVFPDDYDFLNLSVPAFRVFESEDREKALKKYGTEQVMKALSTQLPDNIGMTKDGNKEVQELFGEKQFSFPKPSSLIKHFISSSTTEGDIVLDFFAGSGTTAQAVMELNREDDNNRRFICIQLPEPTENERFPNIAEIAKERIRRVIAQMKPTESGKLPFPTDEDLGFKVFKLAESNMRLWTGVKDVETAEYLQQMALFTDPLVEGWEVQSVIYEIAIREGYSLNVTIEPVDLEMDNTIYRVSDPDKEQHFFICLDNRISPDPTYTLNLTKTDLFICRDVALDDTTAANIALNCRLKTI